jgi:hypothetical protein
MRSCIPLSSSSATTSAWPYSAAVCSGVHLPNAFASTSAPAALRPVARAFLVQREMHGVHTIV